MRLDEQLFREVVAMKEIMINSLYKLECINVFVIWEMIWLVQEKGQKQHQDLEYIGPGQRSVNWLLCWYLGKLLSKWKEGLQYLYSECLRVCDWNLGCKNGGYGEIEENVMDDGQMDVRYLIEE